MKSRKVCLLTSEFLPNWGGVGTYCLELAKVLAGEVELHVVTVGREENGKLEYSKADMECRFDGKITVHLLTTCPAKDTFLYNAKMQFAVAKKFPDLIKEYDFDLIHTNIPQMADILLKVKGQINTPSVTTVHTVIAGHKQGIEQAKSISGLTFSDLDRSEKFILMTYPALRFAEWLYFKRSKNFIAVSNWMSEILQRDFPSVNGAHVIHNGVDVDRFSPDISKSPQIIDVPEGPIVLVPSRLTALKGIHILIQAIPKIMIKIKKVHFVFAGAGPREAWVDLLETLNVSRSSYTFLGHINHEYMPLLYTKADLTILPSLYEDLPFAVLESMSCGSPIISSNVGGIPEVITNGGNGMLFQRGNVDELARITTSLLEDEDLRKRLSKNARQTIVERFSWAVVAKRTKQVYDEILGA